MKRLIDQLHAEQLHLQRLIYAIAVALRSNDASALRMQARKLRELAVGHIGFQRTVLPDVARLDEIRGEADRAQRVRTFVQGLGRVEEELRALVAPLENVTTSATAQPRWTAARVTLEEFLGATSTLLQDHASDSGSERRQMPRVSCDAKAVLLADQQIEARLRDLSMGGMQLELSEPLPQIGSLIDVRLLLTPSSAPIEVSAEVRWHGGTSPDRRSRGAGARFSSLDPTAGLRIAQWVANTALRDGFVRA